MDRNKLNKIIEKQNEEREYQALRQAESIIAEIAKEQNHKRQADERIVELRGELKALEVEQLDQAEVLGGDDAVNN